jgi:GNAT superfamily N-acetyltransferase
LFVRETARGTGIGRALLAEAERLTRARGLDRMLIGVAAGNDRAEETYRRAGYAPYSREMIRHLD